MGITRSRLPVAAAALTAFAALIMSGAVTASAGPEAEGVRAAAGFNVPYEFKTPNGEASPETCRDRLAPGNGRAHICTSYHLYSNGETDGYYRGTLYGSTFVQVLIDGNATNLTTRPDFRGIWWEEESVKFRACTASGCGAWS